MLSEEERQQLQNMMRQLAVLNAELNEHEEKVSQLREQHWELHQKIEAKLNGQ